MSTALFLATIAAGFAYVISPGPAFLAVFGLAAARGRPPAARFVIGHLAGDLLWAALALAAIIGISRVGPLLFDALGIVCGTTLIILGTRAALSREKDAAPAAIGAQRPLAAGVLFGLTNPKAYPVSTAMFTAIALPFASPLHWIDAPGLLGAAFIGFVLADIVIVFSAGLPAVRRFFNGHGQAITRVVGVLFIAFGVKSLADAGRSVASRT